LKEGRRIAITVLASLDYLCVSSGGEEKKGERITFVGKKK